MKELKIHRIEGQNEMQELGVSRGRGPHPTGPPNDKGERLRTDGSPTDEDHGPVLHLGNIEHAWGGERGGRGERRGGRAGKGGEESSLKSVGGQR